jgi:ABC-type multidrug transport system fused ATPase/permease subunit
MSWPLTVVHRSLSQTPVSTTSFKSLLAQVTPHKGVLLLAVILMLGESAVALANPWIAGRFTELILTPDIAAPLSLPGLLLLWAVLLAVQSVLSFGNRYLLGSTGETMLASLRIRLYDHLQSLPLGYFPRAAPRRGAGPARQRCGPDQQLRHRHPGGATAAPGHLRRRLLPAVPDQPAIAALAGLMVPSSSCR